MADPQLSLELRLQRLNTHGEGLSGTEAIQRLQRHGPNALPEKKKSKLALLLYRLLDPERTVMHGGHDLRRWHGLRLAAPV